jgi:dTDP-4-dehydrorhamnose reductase
MIMRLLLVGGRGQLGTELCQSILPQGVELVTPPESELDLREPITISDAIAAEPWSAVINAAGYTDVDRAESEEAVATAINGAGPGRLAEETARHGIPLIHISTDYVFDGQKGAPYVEDDAPAPVNAYGSSKLAGEQAVQMVNPRHVILRTAWLYSPYGKNFVRAILRLAEQRQELRIIADQRGCPTAARDLAKVCVDIALKCVAAPNQARYGLYHCAGGGEASWFEFATAIVHLSAARLGRRPQVVPIRTIDYPTAAVRPTDSRLECGAIARAFGLTLRPWRVALAETIDRLLPVGIP